MLGPGDSRSNAAEPTTHITRNTACTTVIADCTSVVPCNFFAAEANSRHTEVNAHTATANGRTSGMRAVTSLSQYVVLFGLGGGLVGTRKVSEAGESVIHWIKLDPFDSTFSCILGRVPCA